MRSLMIVVGYNNEGPIHLPISSSTGSQVSMSFIRHWLNLHNHEDPFDSEGPHNLATNDSSSDIGLIASPATQPLNYRRHPSRLIDLSVNDGHSIRILASSDDRILDGRYAALSYCWRGKETCMLTSGSLKRFSNSVDVDDLPCTIRDAIEVTRSLGLKCLWVDALCRRWPLTSSVW